MACSGPMAEPMKQQSTTPPFSRIFDLSTRPLIHMPAISSPRIPLRVFPRVPNAVLIPSTNTTSLLINPPVYFLFFNDEIVFDLA
jgi:hypothetical protein